MGERDAKLVAVTATVRGGRIRVPAAVLDVLKVSDGGQLVFFLSPGRHAALVEPFAASPQSGSWP
jgi:hypothetical protein